MTQPYRKYVFSQPVTVQMMSPDFVKVTSPFQGTECEAALVMGGFPPNVSTWIKGDMLASEVVPVSPTSGHPAIIEGILMLGQLSLMPQLVWFPVRNYIGIQSTGNNQVNMVFVFRKSILVYPTIVENDKDRVTPHPLHKQSDAQGFTALPNEMPERIKQHASK